MFENKWLLEKKFLEAASRSWEQTKEIESLQDKLQHCGNLLLHWSNSEVGNTTHKIKLLSAEIDRLYSIEESTDYDVDISLKEKELEKLLTQEKIHWQQRSRKQWLEVGDRNTSYFHHCTKARRSRNHIDKLVDDNEATLASMEDICNCIIEFYDNLFKTTNPSWSLIDQALRFVEPLVDNDMNRYLDQDFSIEEIKRAAFDQNPHKAPGPDGFTASFYHHAWDTIEVDILKAAASILNQGESLNSWNETVVYLIPKNRKPEKIKDFRPISLCNVSYKIVARAITNRLRSVLDKIIDPCQSAFVPGRLITDNILIGFEVMH